MVYTDKLFEGDTSNPLSDQELEQLFKKFNFHNPDNNPKDVKIQSERLKKAFETLNSVPSGSRALRQLLEAKDETYNIDIRDNATEIDGNLGYYLPNKDHICVSGKLFETEHGAVILAHECLHDLQKNNSGIFSITASEATDAETQAFNQQLFFELGISANVPDEMKKLTEFTQKYTQNPTAIAYIQQLMAKEAAHRQGKYKAVYDNKYQKWLDIAKNPKKTPKGIQPFEPVPGANKAKAYKAYAAQMAALETQAQFIKDFVNEAHRNPTDNTTESAFDLGSIPKRYKDQNHNLARFYKDKQIPAEFIDDAIKRNPFLNQEDFNKARLAYGEEPVYSNDTAEKKSSGGFISWFKNSWFGRLIGINDEPAPQEATPPTNNENKDQSTPSATQPEKTQVAQAQAQPAQAQTQAPQEQQAPDARRALAQFKMPEQDNQQQAMAYQKYGGREA